MMNEHISSIMTKNVITVTPDDYLDRVKTIFDDYKIHHIPVVKDKKLVGLVTTWDLWKYNHDFEDYKNIKVKKVMSTRIAKISPEDKVGTAAEIFLGNNFHALPVVEKKKLVGIVTSFDILKYEFKKEYPRPILYKNVYKKTGSS